MGIERLRLKSWKVRLGRVRYVFFAAQHWLSLLLQWVTGTFPAE